MSLKALLSSPLPLGSSELFLSLAFAVLSSLCQAGLTWVL